MPDTPSTRVLAIDGILRMVDGVFERGERCA